MSILSKEVKRDVSSLFFQAIKVYRLSCPDGQAEPSDRVFPNSTLEIHILNNIINMYFSTDENGIF